MASSSLMFPAEASGLLWNPEAVNARNAMTDFYTTLLNEVKKTDPAAQLSTVGGMAHIVTGGKSIPITSTAKADADNYGITPDQWVSSNVLGQPLTLTADQRAKVQASQLSALQGSAGPDTVGGQQVQQQIDNLKAFWQTPAGQGIDPNTGNSFGVPSSETRQTYPDTGVLGTSPFAGYSVTPPTPTTPPVKRVVQPLVTPLPRVNPGAQRMSQTVENALAPQVNQSIVQPNNQYQQRLNTYNRWGRGGR